MLALMSKVTGTDIYHLCDTGYQGVAIPENIMAYSIAIRGVRHTYHRMASSINRYQEAILQQPSLMFWEVNLGV